MPMRSPLLVSRFWLNGFIFNLIGAGRLNARPWDPGSLSACEGSPVANQTIRRPAALPEAAVAQRPQRAGPQAHRHRSLQVQAGRQSATSRRAAARLYLFDIATKKAEALDRRRCSKRRRPPGRPTASGSRSWAVGQGRGALQHVERVRDGSARRRRAAAGHPIRRRQRPPPSAAGPSGAPTARASRTCRAPAPNRARTT